MSDPEKKQFVNMASVRNDEQRKVMEEIIKNGECPFCPENIEKYHSEDVLKKIGGWVLTRNQWPYENTLLHLLAIPEKHVERLSELDEDAFSELQQLLVWAEEEYSVESGGIAMRFGDTERSGATVSHLHVHLIVPDPNKPEGKKVKFKISD